MGIWTVGEEGEGLERIKNVPGKDRRVSRACREIAMSESLVKE